MEFYIIEGRVISPGTYVFIETADLLLECNQFNGANFQYNKTFAACAAIELIA